jgi:hypothetical protein
MARPWVLVSLLLLIVFTSQLEWKQQFGNEIEASPNISQRDQQQHSSNREEVVKEKVSFFILFSFLNYIWCFLCSVLYVYETRKGKKGKTQLFFLNLGIEDFVPCIYTRIWSSGFHRRIWESFIVFCVFGKSGSVLEFQICKLGKHNNAI